MNLSRIFFFLPVIAALCLGGCGGPVDPTPTLTVTMSLGEEEWDVFRREIFPRFEQEHGIKIKAHQIESDHLATKLQALQSGGRSPIDLFAQDNMSLAPLVNQGLVVDLSEHEERIPSAVLPNLTAAGKFNGRLMFMPFRPNVQIAYYNAKAFEKYDLAPPRTWEEWLTVGEVFKNKEGIGRILLKGYGGNPTATQIYEFILQAGGDPYAFNDAGCVRAFEFLQQLSPFLSPESNRAKWDTVNEILARQEAYLSSNWPFGVVILIKDYKLDFIKTYSGWAGPAGEKHVIGGDVLGIPEGAKNVKAALDFIVFLQSREVQEILVSRLGWPSIRGDAYAQVADWQKPHFASVKEALKKGVFRKNVTWWPAYQKYVTRAFQQIVFEGKPVKETLDRYKQQLTAEIPNTGP